MLCFLWLQSEKALCCAGWLIISASWEYQVIVTYSLVSPRNENRGEMYVFFSSLFLPLLQSPPVPPACGLAEVSVRTGGFCQRERERYERLSLPAGSVFNTAEVREMDWLVCIIFKGHSSVLYLPSNNSSVLLFSNIFHN